MSKWIKLSIILAILSVFFLVTGFLALPKVLSAVPGQYRHHLPDPLLEIITTPLPAALPAPETSASNQSQFTIPALSAVTVVSESPTPPIISSMTPITVAMGTAVDTPTSPPDPTPTPTATATPTATPTPEPPPPAARIDGLRIVAQGFNNCGPATLTLNLNFYGYDVTQTAVAGALKPNPEDRNVTPEEMANYVLANTGLRAAVYRGGDLNLIKRFVAAGLPLIIEKGYEPGQSLGWMGHYLTIFAYDDEKEEFLGMDTYLGPFDSSGYRYSYEQIATYWRHFNHAFITIYRPEQEEIVHNILGPELLDPLLMWQKNALAAHTETKQQPEDAFAWFNLGSSLTRLGDMTSNTEYYAMAAAAFDEARGIGLPPRMLWYQFTPYRAYLADGRIDDVMTLTNAILAYEGGRGVEETYLYRGHARLALGDREGARADYNRAVQLNRNFSLAQEALESLE